MDEFLKRERREWLVAATVLTMLTWLMICLLSACKAKPAEKPAPTRTILIIDTTRVQILHRVDEARTRVQVLKERNQPTTNAYEAAAAAYDTVDVDLP
ncbi:hypothetical protein [Fibrella aestuarina]|nr:hypothetical protein [Fibrella aestuarina]